ncbi:hypothetical protein cypCar_00001290, partial [Cyprinus carpio]
KLAVLSLSFAALAVLIGERVITLRHLILYHRELSQNYLPNCHYVEGIECGAEDITILENGLAFLSTCVKHPDLPSYSDDPGKIYTLNLLDSKIKIKATNIKGDFDKDSFNPHGISLYTDDKDGAVYLFVVNHPQGKSQVEIFRYDEDENALQYIKTIKHELLHNVNDIVAVGTESFYATNDHYFTNGILKLVEPFLSLPWCDVVYYSPQTVQEVDVGSLCDNIEVDRESGELWLGCHPNGRNWLHQDPNDPPGSEVIRIENILSEKPKVTQVYADDGSVIIASSVATQYGGKLLIGTVYQKALICDLKHVSLSYRELTQNYLPNCHHIEGIEYGAEDITVLENGLAFLSTGLKYPGLPSYSDDPGKIYTLNLLDSKMKIKAMNIKGDFDKDSFNPHGISLYTDDKDGAVYLFVVNHPQGKSQVEIFRFIEDENALQYIKTIKHELLHNVNDIVAVGTESFYATNDHYFTNGILKFVEPFLSLPWCDVVYYSPQTVQEVDVGSLCDNIEVDRESGDLWLGCHPNGLKCVFHDPNDPPGSEVIRIENILSEKPRVTQLYSDDGSVIVASSVATQYGGKLLIGTVYQKALICDLKL